MSEMALIPLEDYQNFCITIRHWLSLPETEKITSGEAYWMLLMAFKEAEKHQGNEDWLLSGGARDEYINDRVLSIRAYGFNNATGPTVAKFPKVTTLGNYAFSNNHVMEQAYFPGLKSSGLNAFRGASVLRVVDLGNAGHVDLNTFYDAASLNTVILRRETTATLSGLNAFKNTPFAEGGTGGGKIYVPEALIETYKTATNWSVLYSYGTFEFVPLEGSEYE